MIDDVWDNIVQFNEKYFPGWRGYNEVFYSNALAGEVGEVCNITKHRAGGGTNKQNPSDHELMEELADVFIYLVLLVECRMLDNTTFANMVQDKININAVRMEQNYENGRRV